MSPRSGRERAGRLHGAAQIVSALLGATWQRDIEGAWNVEEAAVLGATAGVTLRRALSSSLCTRSRLQSCGNGCRRWLAQASASQALAPAAHSRECSATAAARRRTEVKRHTHGSISAPTRAALLLLAARRRVE